MDARRRNRAGFTLIELLVTLAILGLAIAASGTINYLNQRDTIENKLLTELQDDMRHAMETIVPFLRMGKTVVIIPNQCTVQIPPGVGTVEQFVFGLDPVAHTLRVGSPLQPICDHIASLTVTETDGLVSIELVSLSTLPGVQHSLPITMTTKVMMRNHP